METIFGVNIITEPAHTYQDYILLPIPHEDVEARTVHTQTKLCRGITLNIPIVGANMGHLGGRMAEKLAQLGGIGVLCQDFRLEELISRIDRVKRANPYFHMPIALSPDDWVIDAIALMEKRHFDCVVVVDADFSPIGIATQKDLERVPRWEKLKNVMKKELLIVHKSISTENANGIMIKHKISHLPVTDDDQKLLGCLTPLDITLRMHGYQPALDEQGRLRVSAAMGMKIKESLHPVDLAKLYIEHGVDALVLDIANGYLSDFVRFVSEIRREIGADFPLIAGNVADYDGAACLFDAGCDTVKVGIGPGGACTTRRETGVGVPQATAIIDALRATASDPDLSVLADGGITNGFDMSIAMILGASTVMVGSLFAGTYESAFETEFIDGQMWKRWRGNASSSAATYRRQKIYGEKYITEDLDYSEGADGVVKVTGSMAAKVFQLTEELKRRIAYSNSTDIASFQAEKERISRLKNMVPISYSHFSQLKFKDLYIKPQSSDISSRMSVKPNTNHELGLSLKLPYIALPADFVQKKICTIMAQLGGMGFISRKREHEDIDYLVERVKAVRSVHPYYFFPSIQESNEEIGKTLDFIQENVFSCAIIVKNVENDRSPIGIATRRDLQNHPRTDPLYEVFKRDIITVPEGIDLREANELMTKKSIHHLPVVNSRWQLVGCITPRDMTLRVLYGLEPNVDKSGRLKVCAALNTDEMEWNQILYESILLSEAGSYILLLDTIDGSSENYTRMVAKVSQMTRCKIMAAGISAYTDAARLFQSGADIIKVGSPICDIPHIETISECARAAKEAGKAIITEDYQHIHHPRDANLSLLLGANAVGIRHLLEPTFENSVQPAYPGKKSPDRRLQTHTIRKTIGDVEYLMEDLKARSKISQTAFKNQTSSIHVIVRMLTGLRSSCTYSNAGNLSQYQQRAIIGIQSPSGYAEGNPHAFSTGE